jgi:ankyrin repeat protein
VHSNGWTALHEAAWCGNRIIVGKLIAAKAAVDAQTIGG